MYKHIIFDFGGVFLNLGGKNTGVPNDLARVFGISEEKAADFWRNNKNKLITGRESPRQFLAFMGRELGIKLDIEKAYAAWTAYNSLERKQINWKLVTYTKQLKKRYMVHMLTDTIDLDRGSNKWLSQFDKCFDNIFRSYEEKSKKPDKEAFLNLLKKIKAEPRECIFVDDFQDNITAANGIGMKGIVFISLDQLRNAISSG